MRGTRAAVTTLELPLPHVQRGKVREVFALGDALLLVATDRLSAFDIVFAEGIPDKGRVLTGLSDFWLDRLGGSLVAIGNAPTALFRLLELIDQGAPKPAAVIGMPVGFVGAAESKEALAARSDLPFLIVKGRKGGSAMAVAAVNALASEAE